MPPSESCKVRGSEGRQSFFPGAGHARMETPRQCRHRFPRASGQRWRNHYDGARNDWFSYSAMAPAGLWTKPSNLVRFAIEIEKAYAGQSKLLSYAL